MANKRKELNIEESNLWYLVGLITSDGCLSKDGRHIDITSKDYEFLKGIKNLIGLGNKIGIKYGYKKQKSFRIQIANRSFYDFLLSIGLIPNKSCIIGDLKIPEEYFVDFLRGLIDGDGGIQRWINTKNKLEQWNLRISSGSKIFLGWLQREIEDNFGVTGRIYAEKGRAFRLKYGKMAARQIVKHCYYKDCLGLERKIKLASKCFNSYKGWSRSKTINCKITV